MLGNTGPSFPPPPWRAGVKQKDEHKVLVQGLGEGGGVPAGSRTLECHGALLPVLGFRGIWLALPATRGSRGGAA